MQPLLSIICKFFCLTPLWKAVAGGDEDLMIIIIKQTCGSTVTFLKHHNKENQIVLITCYICNIIKVVYESCCKTSKSAQTSIFKSLKQYLSLNTKWGKKYRLFFCQAHLKQQQGDGRTLQDQDEEQREVFYHAICTGIIPQQITD